MSKLFYDHLVTFKKIEQYLKSLDLSNEEMHELAHMIEEMVNHRALHAVLDKLPIEEHNDFLKKFAEAPFDDDLIEYINIRVDGDISEYLVSEFYILEEEILKKLNGQ